MASAQVFERPLRDGDSMRIEVVSSHIVRISVGDRSGFGDTGLNRYGFLSTGQGCDQAAVRDETAGGFEVVTPGMVVRTTRALAGAHSGESAPSAGGGRADGGRRMAGGRRRTTGNRRPATGNRRPTTDGDR